MKKILLAATCLSFMAGTAFAADVNLRYSHFMPAASWQHDDLFEAWGTAVSEASDGTVDVTVFPAETLGSAVTGYDNARNRITDIAWTVQGYTANRFPLSHIVELPGLFETAEIGSCGFQKLYDSGALDAEYEDTHVLFVHTHGPGHLHTRGHAVQQISDLEGLKIRRPTTVIGTLLQELGAEPVGMPAPQIYESVQRGVIDGYMLTWEAAKSFRASEVSDNHTNFGFYSLAFVTAMNKSLYEGLPEEAKAAIDANSGMEWSLVAGRGYDSADEVALAEIGQNSTIHEIPEAERGEWEAAAERAREIYLEELEAAGLPGREVYEQFRGYVAECEAELL
ncbi:MAG: TRAP transporter substrate-binding protein [Rhizobiaceae bacterium]